LTPEDILNNINPDNIHFPVTKMVVLENTVNRGGGSYYTLDQVAAISKAASKHGLIMHLDGARLFNALAETKEDARNWGNYFHTISICLSKGLGAPVGSVLTGDRATMVKAKRVRKVLGGGMRQAGYLAAAGIYALDHHVQSLADDNRRARALGAILSQSQMVERVHPVDTNIVIAEIRHHLSPDEFLNKLKSLGILALAFGGQQVRMVTHREITDNMVDYFGETLNKLIN
jgi:threonine aldolase